jgi:predicted metal-dependent phosphotriesterase family hydrolase
VPHVRTVPGPVESFSLGCTLSHEHSTITLLQIHCLHGAIVRDAAGENVIVPIMRPYDP